MKPIRDLLPDPGSDGGAPAPAPAPAPVEPSWEPSREFIASFLAEQGWPQLADLSTAHLTTPGEIEKLEGAIEAARRFAQALQEGATGLALVLVASGVEGDDRRTGFGCGKTHLARSIHYLNSTIQYSPSAPGQIWVKQNGRFLEARELMALFDKDDFVAAELFSGFGNLLIIDDVGREGSLRWEKRDPALQAQEKQDRYYSVIDYCDKRGVNLIITSNLSALALRDLLGGAGWSRLMKMSPRSFRISMTGLPDMRPSLGEQAEEDWGF